MTRRDFNKKIKNKENFEILLRTGKGHISNKSYTDVVETIHRIPFSTPSFWYYIRYKGKHYRLRGGGKTTPFCAFLDEHEKHDYYVTKENWAFTVRHVKWKGLSRKDRIHYDPQCVGRSVDYDIVAYASQLWQIKRWAKEDNWTIDYSLVEQYPDVLKENILTLTT